MEDEEEVKQKLIQIFSVFYFNLLRSVITFLFGAKIASL